LAFSRLRRAEEKNPAAMCTAAAAGVPILQHLETENHAPPPQPKKVQQKDVTRRVRDPSFKPGRTGARAGMARR